MKISYFKNFLDFKLLKTKPRKWKHHNIKKKKRGLQVLTVTWVIYIIFIKGGGGDAYVGEISDFIHVG